MSTEKTQTKILGFPWWMIAVMAVVFMVLGKFDKMITNMVGALGFALVVGSCLGWIGNHIPVWKDWLGGGMLFTSLAAAAFNTFFIRSPPCPSLRPALPQQRRYVPVRTGPHTLRR